MSVHKPASCCLLIRFLHDHIKRWNIVCWPASMMRVIMLVYSFPRRTSVGSRHSKLPSFPQNSALPNPSMLSPDDKRIADCHAWCHQNISTAFSGFTTEQEANQSKANETGTFRISYIAFTTTIILQYLKASWALVRNATAHERARMLLWEIRNFVWETTS